jgi:transposase
LPTAVELWKELPIDKDENGKPEIHHTSIYKKFVKWTEQGSCLKIFYKSLEKLQEHGRLDLSILHGDGTNTIAKKGGEGIGYNGYKHLGGTPQKGEKTIAIHDNQGNIIAPLTVASVNQSDMLLLKESIDDLKRINKQLNLGIKKATILNLDSGFDSKANRKKIWNMGLKPNIKENKRNRKSAKKGRKRFFDSNLYKKRFIIERSFAWIDKFKRLLIRFERKQNLFLGFALLAYSLVNLRYFSKM